jgi:hypothetical protein
VIAPRVLSDETDPVAAVPDYIQVNRDAYFFLKSDDFATEYEYRVVLTASDDLDYTYVDYRDALVGVVLGERVPEWQEEGAVRACSRINVSSAGWNGSMACQVSYRLPESAKVRRGRGNGRSRPARARHGKG